MDVPDLKEILNRYHAGRSTDEEKALIEAWYTQLDLEAPELTTEQLAEMSQLKAPVKKQRKIRNLLLWIPAAAALLLVGLWGLYDQHPQEETATLLVQGKQDVAPGGNKAILKLANGQQVILDEVGIGDISQQADVVVLKKADGSIVYQIEEQAGSAAPALRNSISTPRGGQYHLTLSDGTKVWLNAASSISYPVHFASKRREVEITGEVYFEVQHNDRPFVVKSRDQEVEVLGTHFNINAYEEERYTKTTLAEGSVKVGNSRTSNLLKPGQQALLNEGTMQVIHVDTEAEIAWKNGDFSFKNQPTKALMRHLARWYVIDIDYSGYTERNDTFSGEISRSRNLSAVLRMLEKTNSIQFRIEGKRLYIMN